MQDHGPYIHIERNLVHGNVSNSKVSNSCDKFSMRHFFLILNFLIMRSINIYF